MGEATQRMYVVDFARHNDCDEGLVGPFSSREDAQRYVEGIKDKYERKWAAIRPVAAADV